MARIINPHTLELPMAAAQLDDLKRWASRGVHATGVAIGYYDINGQFTELSFPPRDPNDLARLVAACAPATFGRGEQEVLDPAYRQAAKLDPNQFMTSLNLAEFPILAEVQRLLGSEATGVCSVLHKLNIYGPGGFFKAHRDTPRSARCVGTLVVCLPTTFSGGEFVVRSGNKSFSHTFDCGADAASGKVQWCAFFSDCEHEVLPVRDGYRVTLTYALEHQPLQHPMQMDAQPLQRLANGSRRC